MNWLEEKWVECGCPISGPYDDVADDMERQREAVLALERTLDAINFNVGDKVVIRFQYPFASENFKEGTVGEVRKVHTQWEHPCYYVQVNDEWEKFFGEDLELANN